MFTTSFLQCIPAVKISSTNIYNIEILVAELENVRNIRELDCEKLANDTLPTLCSIIKSMNNLQYLKCGNIGDITSTSAQLLGDTLRTNTFLRGVSLHGVSLHLTGSMPFLEVVKCCANLLSLDLSNCSICSQDVASLFCNHDSWVNLHSLNLCNNKISSKCTQVLSKVLFHCKNLRCLDLSHNFIDDNDCFSLAEGLQNHTNLLKLKLGWNRITSGSIASLIQVITCNHLQHLDLSRCKIGSEGIADLVDDVCGDTLQTLEVTSNSLGLDGAVKLGIGLKSCRQLVKLDISCNNIGSYGMSSLAEGLQYCTNLQVLDLHNNDITSDGVSAVIGVMKSCRYLQKLDFGCNSFGVDDAAVLVVGWQHKCMLTLLLHGCLGYPHDLRMSKGERCCSNCDHLLELYNNNDYVILIFDDLTLPKLVSSS